MVIAEANCRHVLYALDHIPEKVRRSGK
jgi:hypothetical protein